MSAYNEKYNLFMQPETNQYGNHMVMTNVQKQNKHKYVNIDTKFSDEYEQAQTTNENADHISNQSELSTFTISLPHSIREVKTMKVIGAEIPMAYYNISSNLGNNYFKITISGTESIIELDDGNYNIGNLNTEIASKLTIAGITTLTFTLVENGKTTIFNSGPETIVDFAINKSGINDKYRFKSKLGWCFGFRNTTYTIDINKTLSSEKISNLLGTKYLYITVEEFNKGNENSFVVPLYSSLINKNIIARIGVNQKDYPFGTILPSSLASGSLISDTRNYNGKIDLQKLKVSLLNDDGIPVVLNGSDFSFCIELQHE
jgi:hypothetical protein